MVGHHPLPFFFFSSLPFFLVFFFFPSFWLSKKRRKKKPGSRAEPGRPGRAVHPGAGKGRRPLEAWRGRCLQPGRRAGRKLISRGVERGGQGVGVGQGGISSRKCALAAVGRALPRRLVRSSPEPSREPRLAAHPGQRRRRGRGGLRDSGGGRSRRRTPQEPRLPTPLPPAPGTKAPPGPPQVRGRAPPTAAPHPPGPHPPARGCGGPAPAASPRRGRGAGGLQRARPGQRLRGRNGGPEGFSRWEGGKEGGGNAAPGAGGEAPAGGGGAERGVSGLCWQAGGAAPRPARLPTMLDGLKMEESLQSALDPATPFSSLLGKSGHPACPPGDPIRRGTAGRARAMDGHGVFGRPGDAFPRLGAARRRCLRPGCAPGARLRCPRFVPRSR